MRISTKGRYGLKAVMELSRNYGGEPISVRELAARADVSATYLEQLFKKLRTASVVASVRGAQGGYTLARPPGEIPVGSVLRALEGSTAPMFCAEDGFSCENADVCVESFLYRKIRESIDSVIDSLTLADMLEEESDMQRRASATARMP